MNDELWQAGLAHADKLTAKQSATPFSTTPIEEPTEPGITDYLMDIPRGIGAGGLGLIQGVGGLADKVVETFGGDLIDDEGAFYQPVIKTKTWLGSLVNGLTQFSLAFIPFAGVAGRIGKALEFGKLGTSALRIGAGAAADFTAFNEHQERLSNLIQEFPALQNPVTEYLAAKPGDNWAEGRLKNAIEGLGLTGIAEAVAATFRGFKSMKTAAEAKDAEAFVKAAEQTAKDVEPFAKVGEPPYEVTAKYSFDGTDFEKTGRTDLTKQRGPEWETQKTQVLERIQKNVDSNLPFEDAVEDAFKTHLNLDRLKIDTETEITIRNITDIMDEVVQKGVGGVQALSYTKKLARDFIEYYGGGARFLEKAAEDAANVKGLASRLTAFRVLRNVLAKDISTLAHEYKAGLVEGEGVESVLKVLKQRIGGLLNLHYNTQLIQTEAARTVSAGRIMAGVPDLDVERMLKTIDNTLQGKGKVHPEELVNAIVNAGDDPKALKGVLSWFENNGPGIIQKTVSVHNEYWINALLSGMKTQLANITNQLANSFLLPADRLIGGLVMGDKQTVKSGFRLYTGLVSSAFDVFNLAAIAGKGSPKSSVGSALHAFWNEGGVIEATTKGDYQKAITGANLGLSDTNPIAHAINYLGKTIRMPSRFMTGVDELFKQVNYRAYLRDEAFRVAEKQGVKPNDLGQFVADYIAKGFDETGKGVNEAALLYAQKSTMTQPLLEGTIGKSVQNMVSQHPLLRMFAPFVRVPTNIFRTAVTYTPGINLLQKEFRTKWMSTDPIQAAEARGRYMLGGMFWAAAASVALSGKITGHGPSNKQEREVLLQSGWQPYSFVIDNEDGTREYIQYRRIEPFGMILSLVADYVSLNRHLNDDDNTAIAQAMTISIANNLTSKTYLTGLAEFASLLSQPDQYAKRFFQQRIGSYVPNLVGQLNPDDTLHDTRSILDAAMRRIPGLSETLPPRRNMFGEPVPVPQGYLPFGAGTDIARMTSPIGYSKSVSDPVKEELTRLQHGFGLPARRLQGVDLAQFVNANGQDAYDRYQELHGQVVLGGRTMPQALEHLITSERYQRMPYPETEGDSLNPRVREIQSVIARYREAASTKMMKEYPEIRRTIRDLQQKARSGPTSPVLQKLLH